MSYRIAPLGRGDLEEIRRFTVERWGHDQWLTYYRQLVDCFDRIDRAPQSGRLRPALGIAYRSVPCGAHIVFWRDTADGPVILRIIHQRRSTEGLRFADALT